MKDELEMPPAFNCCGECITPDKCEEQRGCFISISLNIDEADYTDSEDALDNSAADVGIRTDRRNDNG
jgi:hypothetical protein